MNGFKTLATILLLLSSAAVAAGDRAPEVTSGRAADSSVPAPTADPEPPGKGVAAADTPGSTDLAGNRSPESAQQLPYGAGYEARQRGFGRGGGRGMGRGGGRGMGRGR
jgi:hypothetical protein